MTPRGQPAPAAPRGLGLRIWRQLASAGLAGALLAADLGVLTLFLNPEITLPADALALGVSLVLPVWLGATAGLLALAALANRVLPASPRPPLPDLPWFTTLTFLVALCGGALFALNLLHYQHSIPLGALRGLARATASLFAIALVLLGALVDTRLFPRRGRGLSAAAVVLAAAAIVVVPLALRPSPVARSTPVPLVTDAVQATRQVLLVGIDGVSLPAIVEAARDGRAPAFARMLRRGSAGPLGTLRPTEGPPIWTTIFTGRLPRDHGIKSFSAYRLRGSSSRFELLPIGAFVGVLERLGCATRSPVTSASRKTRALWNVLGAFGIQSGIVRGWGTWPPEPVNGFMLSHFFHALQDDPARAAQTLHPPQLLAEVRARVVKPADVEALALSAFVSGDVEVPGDSVPWRRELVDRALGPDLTYLRAGNVLRAAYHPAFFATYFYGMDVVGHAFTRYDQPDRFGNVRPEEVRRYGPVLPHYLSAVSGWVGELLDSRQPGDVLIVVSGYGMQPLSPARRLLAALTGSFVSGSHTDAPDGFVLAIGDGIRAGGTLQGASVLDIAPTVLYLMGLPVARDMEGRALTELFDEDFARAHPVTFIPSYESLAVSTPAQPAGLELPPLPDDEP